MPIMEKSKLFTGKYVTQLIDLEISKGNYLNEHILFIDCEKLKSSDIFFNSNATPDTKIIVIKNIPLHFNLDFFYNSVTTGIKFNRKKNEPFYIKPIFIFACNESVVSTDLPNSASFLRRVEIIDNKN